MTTTAPDLSLGDGGPQGVRDARRWVVRAVGSVGHPELAACAEMGVSELVTNALLHGAAPIIVRVGGTRQHPRVEVRDASPEPPRLPDETASGPGSGSGPEGPYDAAGPADPGHAAAPGSLDALEALGAMGDLDELGDLGELEGLLTFGRGLAIVARASRAWGAELEPDGKVVWFEPAPDFAEGDGPPGQITGVQVVGDGGPAETGGPGSEPVELRLLGAPVGAVGEFERTIRELRREARLLALAHHDDYPMAGELATMFGTLERPLQRAVAAERLAVARHRDRRPVDLVVHLPRSEALGLARYVDVLDLTDAFCREERLLALPRTPAQRAFQAWFLTELAGQAGGREPRRWGPTQSDVRRSSAS